MPVRYEFWHACIDITLSVHGYAKYQCAWMQIYMDMKNCQCARWTTSICSFSLLSELYSSSQTPHWTTLTFIWDSLCSWRFALVKSLPHLLHVWGFSFVCFFSCFCKVGKLSHQIELPLTDSQRSVWIWRCIHTKYMKMIFLSVEFFYAVSNSSSNLFWNPIGHNNILCLPSIWYFNVLRSLVL